MPDTIDGNMPYVDISSTREHIDRFLRRKDGTERFEGQSDILREIASGVKEEVRVQDDEHDYILSAGDDQKINLKVFYREPDHASEEAEPSTLIGM